MASSRPAPETKPPDFLGPGIDQNLSVNAQVFYIGAIGETRRRRDFSNGRRHVLVLVRTQARPTRDNADLAAEPPRHLAEFQTDVAAVQHQQMARQEIDFYHRAVREVIDVIKAGNVRHRRTRTEIDEDLTGCRDLTANPHSRADRNPE